jgi:hypothetical protein
MMPLVPPSRSAGTWAVEWIDTKTAAAAGRTTVAGGRVRTLEAPTYETEIAVRLLKRCPLPCIPRLNSVSHVATLDCRLYDPLSRGAASPEAAR